MVEQHVKSRFFPKPNSCYVTSLLNALTVETALIHIVQYQLNVKSMLRISIISKRIFLTEIPEYLNKLLA